MVLDRANNTIDHKIFSDLPDYFLRGDLLVLNNTKVQPIRLIGTKKNTGGKVEILLVQEIEPGVWNAIVKSAGRIFDKMEIIFKEINISATLIGREASSEELWLLQFQGEESVNNIMKKIGRVPLPPYIKRNHNNPSTVLDRERYQTVYASKIGAIAAPTAGLHFTKDSLKKIKEKGVEITDVTLHTGIGTFKPVKTEFIKQHFMNPEYFEISNASGKKLRNAIKNKRRIIAVGTTTVRTIESVRIKENMIKPRKGYTNLFICPGFNFLFVKALITNFHLPKSTLLMLVYSFAGKDLAKKAYKEAIAKKYRFYSYGDAMLVL
jgi:S-adenosylmethionine:tRNA ribosyltransferase-isomerase